jgi:hypothetical protein
LSTVNEPDDVDDSYDAMTLGEMLGRREKLKNDAATRLGEILFAYGVFERLLDFCIVCTRVGQGRDRLTSMIQDYSLDKKIELLASFVDQIFTRGSKQHTAYQQWIVTAHAIRLNRNDLAHGWWDIDVRKEQVINYRGIATAEHRERRYSLDGLELFEQKINSSARELHGLRTRFPLETATGMLGEGGS